MTRWVAETPTGFAFCPKLPRDLTHQRLLRPSIPGALGFLKHMQGLGDRLGPLFAQLRLPTDLRCWTISPLFLPPSRAVKRRSPWKCVMRIGFVSLMPVL
jgi:hypothetical protein